MCRTKLRRPKRLERGRDEPCLAPSRFRMRFCLHKEMPPGLTTTCYDYHARSSLPSSTQQQRLHTLVDAPQCGNITIMEASSHNTLQIIQNYVNNPSIEVVPPQTIKMEDVTSTTAALSSSLLDVPSADSALRAADSKTTKKRKSWGQVLPEPKTNLPPRKVHLRLSKHSLT